MGYQRRVHGEFGVRISYKPIINNNSKRILSFEINDNLAI